jgi:ribose 5-phosphate isomerase A
LAIDTNNQGLQEAIAQALELVPPNSAIGLGSGRAATAFVRALAERVRQGLRVRAVPTSQTIADLARQVGIPLASLDQLERLDVTVDGADEVDPQLNLIKGLGGALVREKIVAASSERLIIVAGNEKWVSQLGSHGILPVEVVPFGIALCSKRLAALGCNPQPREVKESLFVTDNHNNILDCQISALTNPVKLEQEILAIPGVVGTGLFLGMAQTVLIYDRYSVRKLERSIPE